jgi:hypothetical protein
LYQRTAANLRRLLESVGLQRRSRDTQTLEQYVAERYAPDDAAPEEPSDGSEADSPASLAPGAETALPEPRRPIEGSPNAGRLSS